MSQLNSTHYLKRQCQLNYYYCSKLWLLITMYKLDLLKIRCSCALKKRKERLVFFNCSRPGTDSQDSVLVTLVISFPSFFDYGKELIGCVLLCSSWKKWVTTISF